MTDQKKIIEKLKELAPQGKITCEDARKLADQLNVGRREVGQACDEAGIRVCACELGCF